MLDPVTAGQSLLLLLSEGRRRDMELVLTGPGVRADFTDSAGDEVRIPLVSYQCIAKKGVVLRPTAGCGELHDASLDGLVRASDRLATKVFKIAVDQGVSTAASKSPVPGSRKIVGTAKALAEETEEANDALRVWVGSGPTLYGVAAALLPAVFRAFLDRLRDVELGALHDASLFTPQRLSSAEERDVNELQRHLFAKDPEPDPSKSPNWPEWGMAPCKAATEGYDKKKHSRLTKWNSERSHIVFGRSSGDAAEQHIRDEAGYQVHEHGPRVVAELLMRWLREREDAQVPPELRPECTQITDVPALYKRLNGRKTKISSAMASSTSFQAEVGSSGPLRALAGLLDVRIALCTC